MAAKVVGCFLACIRSIPVIFITSIILWSYYAYVVQLCLFTAESIAEKVLYLIFYHPLIILLVWSYWKVIFTPVSTTPNQFFLSAADLELFEHEVDRANRKELLDQVTKNLPVHCRLISGEVRYCEKCKAIKPDRAHHCSICGKCILKMDHHCPWVNNCVCFSNYKFFLLFLAYALTYCLYVTGTSVQYFIHFFVDVSNRSSGGSDLEGLHIVFLFIASVLFAVSLSTLFFYHCYLVACNKSTIETYQPPVFPSGPDKAAFNLGGRKNFLEIFGNDKRYWFLPVHSSHGDGVSFPLHHDHQASLSYHSMETGTAISISETVQSTDDIGAISTKVRDEDVDSLLGQQQ